MTDVFVALSMFIISSSIKPLIVYVDIGLEWHLLLLHVITALGFSTIFVLATLKSKRNIWFIAWYVFYTLCLFVNTNYFEFFGKFLHINSTYVLLPETVVLVKNMAIPLGAEDFLFIIDLPLFLYLLFKHRKNEIPYRHFNAAIRSAAVAAAVAAGILFVIPINYDSKVSTMLSMADDSDLIIRYGFVGHSIIDMFRPSESKNINKIKYGDRITSTGTFAHRPNIVMLQIESLDANVINYQYRGRYVVPYLHDLSTKSIYFPYTLCYRKLGGTSDCEIAVNNSIEPLVDFPLMMDERYQYPNSLVKVLKEGGYSAEAFHGSAGWYYKRLSPYASMGYDNFFDPTVMKLPEKGWGVPDGEVMHYVERHLEKEGKKPFFVSIITMTSHEPFNNFKHFVSDGRFDDVVPALTGRYFASLAYTDRAVKEFVESMQKKYPDTYFFLYGDHTPYVINEGAFRRSVLRDEDEKEMVPLFIITPNSQKRREHGAVASYLDFAPTVLHAAGIPYNFRSLGVDLFAADQTLLQPVVYRGRKFNPYKALVCQ